MNVGVGTLKFNAVHQHIKNAKNVDAYINSYDKTFMKKLNENEDLRNKVLQLLGRKR